MDYSLLLGVHYRAPQHLRSLMSYSQRMSVDGLGIVAEDGNLAYIPFYFLFRACSLLDLSLIFWLLILKLRSLGG